MNNGAKLEQQAPGFGLDKSGIRGSLACLSALLPQLGLAQPVCRKEAKRSLGGGFNHWNTLPETGLHGEKVSAPSQSSAASS